MTPYYLPLRAAVIEFTEKKSRFIGHVSPVANEEEARAFLQSIREQHREASHNVYAYRLREGGISRHSDDGEPSGTGGLPLLNVFVKQDVYDFCAVATRYYGGIMLGAGGLVRAYARCGADVLTAAGIGVMRELTVCEITIPYASFEGIKRLLSAEGAEITRDNFGEEVTLTFLQKTENIEVLQQKMTEISAGTIFITMIGVRNAVCDV